MISKSTDRIKATTLRKQGLSYNEILRSVPVAKSTLSLWLRSLELASPQKQRLTEKKRLAQLKGGQIRHNQRIDRTETIRVNALNEIGEITKRELKLIGSALYWAEGSKQKKYRVSERVIFSNSDPNMVKLFLLWLKSICKIIESDIKYELYIHKNSDVNKAKRFWLSFLDINHNRLKTYFKRSNKQTQRKNVGNNYNGLIRIVVRKSTDLNRKINGWIEGIHRS